MSWLGGKSFLMFKRATLVHPAPQPAALSTWFDREKARLGIRVQMGFKWAHRCIQQLHTVPEKGPFLPIDGWIARLLHGFLFKAISIGITPLCLSLQMEAKNGGGGGRGRNVDPPQPSPMLISQSTTPDPYCNHINLKFFWGWKEV